MRCRGQKRPPWPAGARSIWCVLYRASRVLVNDSERIVFRLKRSGPRLRRRPGSYGSRGRRRCTRARENVLGDRRGPCSSAAAGDHRRIDHSGLEQIAVETGPWRRAPSPAPRAARTFPTTTERARRPAVVGDLPQGAPRAPPPHDLGAGCLVGARGPRTVDRRLRIEQRGHRRPAGCLPCVRPGVACTASSTRLHALSAQLGLGRAADLDHGRLRRSASRGARGSCRDRSASAPLSSSSGPQLGLTPLVDGLLAAAAADDRRRELVDRSRAFALPRSCEMCIVLEGQAQVLGHGVRRP